MNSRSIDREAPVQGALVIHPDRDDRASSRSSEARLEEACGLTLALDLQVRDAMIAPLRKRTPATLFGSGKVKEIGDICHDLDVDVAVVDDQLTPVQQRNLEKAWKVKVIDRTALFRHQPSSGAVSMDEFAVALHRDSAVAIDPALGWHLWATDLCLQAEQKAKRPIAQILDVPLFHNSTNAHQLPPEFHSSARVLMDKYPTRQRFATLCGELTRTAEACLQRA